VRHAFELVGWGDTDALIAALKSGGMPDRERLYSKVSELLMDTGEFTVIQAPGEADCEIAKLSVELGGNCTIISADSDFCLISVARRQHWMTSKGTQFDISPMAIWRTACSAALQRYTDNPEEVGYYSAIHQRIAEWDAKQPVSDTLLVVASIASNFLFLASDYSNGVKNLKSAAAIKNILAGTYNRTTLKEALPDRLLTMWMPHFARIADWIAKTGVVMTEDYLVSEMERLSPVVQSHAMYQMWCRQNHEDRVLIALVQEVATNRKCSEGGTSDYLWKVINALRIPT
jgi:hypothetical protein